MARLAWFSPIPPVRSGIAACSAQLVTALAGDYAIDVYVDEPVGRATSRGRSAHEFVWQHRQTPYDLTVYQLGNSSHHDYMWPYLFRFPGLTVLHDVRLHHARAAALLRTRRTADYRAEFAAAQPETSPDAAELAVKGFDSHLYYLWPMTRLVVQASRATAVHTPRLAEGVRSSVPGAFVEAIHLGHGTLVTPQVTKAARDRVRGRHAIADDAIVFGCFGGLAPDKRLPQILDAFAAVLPYAPGARLLLAGQPASHYDLAADVRTRGLESETVLTGYLETDDELTEYIAACDVALNLRWPTAREVSGPWLRCLAAGKPTIVIDLAHIDVPSLDPRTWMPNSGPARDDSSNARPMCVAADIADEAHSLRIAMRRLAQDADLRAVLGRAAAEWWLREHTLERMTDDYRRIIPLAMNQPAPRPELPAHLADNADRTLRALLHPFGLQDPFTADAQVTALPRN